MAQDEINPTLREHLDRYYPFIEQDAEPPGRSRPNKSGRGQSWVGKLGWRTRHGDAVVMWDLGRPTTVWNAVLPDGSKVKAQSTMGAAAPWRYLATRSPRRWVHGTVAIAPDSVTFTPGDQPAFEMPAAGERPNLEYDLARDLTFRSRLVDEEFADTLYAYLKNGEFWKQDGERIWSIGLSSAAGLVANLRGFGDTYIDYYPHGGSGPVSEEARAARRSMGRPELSPDEAAVQDKKIAWFNEITEILRSMGWRRATSEDFAAAAVATRRDLASWEWRPASATPEWIAKWRAPATPRPGAIMILKVPPWQMNEQERVRHEEIVSQSLQKRLHALAMSGRVTEAEYLSMKGRINQIP
jgi:hypothetical protein